MEPDRSTPATPSPAAAQGGHRHQPWLRHWRAIAAAALVLALIAWAGYERGWYGQVADALGWTCGDNIEAMSQEDLAAHHTYYGLEPWADVPDYSSEFVPTPQEIEAFPPPLGTPELAYVSWTRMELYESNDVPFSVFGTGRPTPLSAELFGVVTGAALPGNPVSTRYVASSLTDGEPAWGLTFTATSPVGGVIGATLVMAGIREEGVIDVVGINTATGERRSCARFQGTDGWGTSVSTAAIGHDEIVLAYSAAGEVKDPDGNDVPVTRLARLQPSTGDGRWDGELPLADVKSLHVSGETVVLSTRVAGYKGEEPFRFYLATDFESDIPVMTVDGDDGTVRWSAAPSNTSAEAVLGVTPTGLILTQLIETDATPGDTAFPVQVQRSVRALDIDGEEVWRATAPGHDETDYVTGPPYVEAAWNAAGAVVVRSRDALFELDPATGQGLWEIPGTVPDGEEGSVRRLEDPFVLDDLLLFTEPGGLSVLDPATGALAPWIHEQVLDVTPLGNHLAVVLNGGTVIVERDAVPVPGID